MPKGDLGTCRTKKSNSELGGRPWTVTSMISTGPAGRMVTVAVALGMQVLAPAETTILNVTASSASLGAAIEVAAISRPIAAGAARNCKLLSILVLLCKFHFAF